jgi:hypothetical protein
MDEKEVTVHEETTGHRSWWAEVDGTYTCMMCEEKHKNN